LKLRNKHIAQNRNTRTTTQDIFINLTWNGKWNWKMNDRKTYVVEAREEGSRHLEDE